MNQLLNSYIDKQIALNTMATTFAMGAPNQQGFMRNNQNTMLGGGGVPRGSGLGQSSTSSGLSDSAFRNRKPALKQEMASAGETGEKPAEAEKEAEGDIRMSSASSQAKPADGDAKPSEPEEQKEAEPVAAEQPVAVAKGFSSLVAGFGDPFKNSRSRKSIVFVPHDKSQPLRGWKSLRAAGVSSKKLGKITKNGDSFVHTSKDGHDGKLYFLNTTAWKELRKRKKVLLE
jgi:hypothetical protein